MSRNIFESFHFFPIKTFPNFLNGTSGSISYVNKFILALKNLFNDLNDFANAIRLLPTSSNMFILFLN